MNLTKSGVLEYDEIDKLILLGNINGLSCREIKETNNFKISVRTIEARIVKMKLLLGASKITQLIAIALCYEMITFADLEKADANRKIGLIRYIKSSNLSNENA